MKKYIETAEVELITLDANDIVTASMGSAHDKLVEETGGSDDEGYGFAPSRYNYRGMATDWEEEW